jgi:hypothetical protein
VFRIYHPLTLNGYSNFINAVKRQRNLGLVPILGGYILYFTDYQGFSQEQIFNELNLIISYFALLVSNGD